MAERPWTHKIIGGPWVDRRGLRCRVVTPFDTPGAAPTDPPWADLPTDQVVVLVENDPVNARPSDDPDRPAYEPPPATETGWSCTIRKSDLAPLTDSNPPGPYL